MGWASALFFTERASAPRSARRDTELGAEGMVFTVTALGERASVQLHLLGRHNVHNALAAIAVGLQSGISLTECATALGDCMQATSGARSSHGEA